MDPQHWQKLKDVLAVALERQPADRSLYLQEAGIDTDLLSEVKSFLAAYDENSQFIEGGALPATLNLPALVEGEWVGHYRLGKRLGAGGMGEVFLAQQEHPVKRRVALKLVRADWSDQQMLSRFKVECQALALMNHNNIAQVFEVGASADGRPFFAMEHIEGQEINGYCDAKKLGIRRRIELLIAVCRGVQHAHQKGIIHRDLKPSNVLVTNLDGKPTPKIIDFGIAKAVEGILAEHTAHTVQGQGLGTPDYMSPEQAAGQEVDTRSDVYSLGVMLFELLVGTRPFDTRKLRQAGLAPWVDTLRNQDPPALGRRLRDLGDRAKATAHRRGLEIGTLLKCLTGDLEAIVSKAISRDPEQRYASAGELAADLHRFLSHEPVLAATPTVFDQFRRIYRRHRLGLIAACGIFLSLVVGVVGTSFGLVRARQAEQSAVEEERRAREEAERANREAETAGEVTRFMARLFETQSPQHALRPDMTLREVLDQNSQIALDALEDQPRVRARLLRAIGTAYFYLGLLEPAEDLLSQAFEFQEQHEEKGETGETAYVLARVHNELENHAQTKLFAEKAVELWKTSRGAEDSSVGEALSFLGVSLKNLREFEEALNVYEAALAIYAKENENSARMAGALSNLGLLLVEMQRFPEAEEKLEKASSIQREVLGDEHPELAITLNNLSLAVLRQGKLERAQELLQHALAIDEKVFGNDHPNLAFSLYNLARMAMDQKDCDLAETHFLRTRKILQTHYGAAHPKVREVTGKLEELGGHCQNI